MSEKHTPLEEFEFRQAARIRTPGENRPKNKAARTPLLFPIILGILLIGALGTSLFFFTQFKHEQKNVQKLKRKLTESEKNEATASEKLNEIQRKLEKTTKKLLTSSKGKGELMAAIDKLQQDIEKQKRKIQTLKKALRAEKTTVRKTRKKQVAAEQKLVESKKQNNKLKNQLNDSADTIRKLRDNIEKLEKTVQTLKSTMNQEGSASKKLVREMLNAQNEAATLKREKEALEKKIDRLKNKVSDLRRVDPGELVPLSDMVTPAAPIVHPTAVVEKKGVFGKIKGFILVNAYIDETGFVKNAFFLESHLNKNERNSVAISQALKTVLKWRFSPALYNEKIPVKVWQPVIIPVNAK